MKQTKKIVFATIGLGASATLLAGCGSSNSGSDLTGTVTIAGSSTVYPITTRAVDEFTVDNSGVKISVEENGTGGGFKLFSKGTIDINNASRHIKDTEKADAEKNGVKYTELYLGVDGITVVVNPENTWAQDLTIEQLAKIFEENGAASTWNEVDPSFPNEKINLYGPTDASGTYDFFGEKVLGKEGAPLNAKMVGTENDNEIVSNVSKDKNAIGFLGFAYYSQNKDKVTGIKVDGIAPEESSITSGDYELSRPLFIYVNTNKMKENEALKAFVTYYVEKVQTLVKDSGYVALNDDDAAKTKSALEAALK